MKTIQGIFQAFSCVVFLLASLAANAQNSEVKILVFYEQSASNTPVAIHNWISTVNNSFQNSGAKISVSLAAVLPLQVTGNNFGEKLNNLRTNTWARQQRDLYGADFVTLSILQGQGGGVGYNSLDPDYAYSVISVGYDNNPVVLAHEIGHGMGLGHSYNQNDFGAKYAYGRGHGVTGLFRTIMADGTYGGAKLLLFSNPDLSVCFGLPCGVPAGQLQQADAVRAINNERHAIASYRGSANHSGPIHVNGSDNSIFGILAGVSTVFTFPDLDYWDTAIKVEVAKRNTNGSLTYIQESYIYNGDNFSFNFSPGSYVVVATLCDDTSSGYLCHQSIGDVKINAS